MNEKQALKKLRVLINADMQDIEREQLRLSGKYEAYSRSLDLIDCALSNIEQEEARTDK